MAYHIKGFNDWKSQRVNEGLTDALKNVSKKILGLISKIPGLAWVNNAFKGTNSWFLNKYMEQRKGTATKGVYYRPDKVSKQIVDAVMGEKAQPEMQTESHIELEGQITEARAPLHSPDLNMVNMTYDQIVDQIEIRVVAIREKFSPETQPPPLLIWGAVGIGKTAAVEQLADKYGMQEVTMSLATIDPDLLLLPKTDDRTGKQDVIPHGDLPVYNSKSPIAAELEAEVNGVVEGSGQPQGGILFLDEVTRAQSVRVTNAMLGLVHNRKIFSWKLGSAWVVVGAANREEDDYEGFTRNAAFYNRFLHVNLVPTAEDFAKFASTFIDRDTEELIIDPMMAEFLKFNSDLLHKFDKDDELAVVFPTPRAWTMGSQNIMATKKAYNALNKKFTEKDAETAVAMAIGITGAKQYFAFLEMVKEIDPKEIKLVWTNPQKAPLPLKGEGGLKYAPHQASALLTAILLDKKGEKLNKEEIINFVKYLVKLDDPTWAIVAMQKFLEDHPYTNMANKKGKFEDSYEDSWDAIMDEFAAKYKGFDPNYEGDDY